MRGRKPKAWRRSGKAYCETCIAKYVWSADMEPDESPPEVDQPLSCWTCGGPVYYELTEPGQRVTFELIRSVLQQWPNGPDWTETFSLASTIYAGLPFVVQTLDYARDLMDYTLSFNETVILKHFIKLAEAFLGSAAKPAAPLVPEQRPARRILQLPDKDL